MILNTKYGELVIYARTVDNEAISQVMQMGNSPLGKDAHIRIMPDCHAGAGCVIGTTMRITDKVCPNLVGVDIGCGVDLVKTDLDFSSRLQALDDTIRLRVPFGMAVHKYEKKWDFSVLRCYDALDREARVRASRSLGTLGGGNHFIEAYEDGYLAVHAGSRNIGCRVAEHYQHLAVKRESEAMRRENASALAEMAPTEREAYRKANKKVPLGALAYLEGEDMEDYLHDVAIMQSFARDNRRAMLDAIVRTMGGNIVSQISSVHNYIDMETHVLRKGAISAKKGETLVIPMNMRDGLLICVGKGNEEWNASAPHGAGRLYSRAMAKELFTVSQYEAAMEGIFTTCVGRGTLDEAPFAYKDYREIMDCIEDTVEIKQRLLPIYNFKAAE